MAKRNLPKMFRSVIGSTQCGPPASPCSCRMSMTSRHTSQTLPPPGPCHKFLCTADQSNHPSGMPPAAVSARQAPLQPPAEPPCWLQPKLPSARHHGGCGSGPAVARNGGGSQSCVPSGGRLVSQVYAERSLQCGRKANGGCNQQPSD
jgi:hypothetical protein